MIDVMSTLNSLPLSAAMAEGDSFFSAAQKDIIERMYRQTFGRNVRKCGCRHRYADACLELRNHIKKMTTKYQLKAGMLIWIGSECYSRKNITDEIVERWFADLPEGCDRDAVWVRHFGDTPRPVYVKDEPVEEQAEGQHADPKPKKKTTKKKGE